MSYTLSLDFKSGIDRRRPISAAVQGALYTCTNAHITRGGDIEKRKAFVSKYTLPSGTFGMSKASGSLYVFGSAVAPSMPSGVLYQRLQHPDGQAMTKILDWDLFNGQIYAVAQFADGAIYHFFNGTRVSSLDSGIVRAAMTNNDGIASHLNGLIDTDAAYDPTVSGSVITVVAAVAGTPFTISASTVDGGGTNDQTAVVANTVANVVGVTEVLSSTSFTVTGGTASAGVNKVSSITINGVEILSTAVDWATSFSATATAIAAQINTYNSTPEYTATASGPTVTIKAAAGSGATPNGFAVSVVVAGDVTTTTPAAMSGGVTAVSAVKQQATVTIGGTFQVGDKFTITIDGKTFGYNGSTSIQGTSCLTHENKMYVTAASLLEFSGVAAPTGFDPLTSTGAGNINMSNHESGSDTLTGLEVYQTHLAIFARRAIQIWTMASDPAENAKFQIIKKTGSRATRSIYAYGDNDLVYLSDSGIRSLRSREAINLATVFDLGTPIDPLVNEHVATLTDAVIESAVSVIEPTDGRLWMAIGGKIFVYTAFTSVGISAWTTYEPGFTPSDMVDLNDRVYVRSGDTIYLYGGDDNATYDASTVTVRLPYVHSDKPATYKQIAGFQADLENVWAVKLYIAPAVPAANVDVGIMEGFTYNDGMTGALGNATHISPELVCTTTGYARVSNMAVHFLKSGQGT